MMNEYRRKKKLERKRKKREGRRRASSTEAHAPLLLLQEDAPLDTSKMSAVLEKLAEPLREALPEEPKREQVLSVLLVAMAAWNTAVLRPPEQVGLALEKLSSELLASGEAGKQVALPVLQMLVERKQQLFPHDNRLILDVDVVEEEGGEFRIVVASMQRPR